MTPAARIVGALALGGLALGACGKKGPPVAPERRLPAAATGLEASVEGEGIVVSWTLPRVRLDNTPLRDLLAVRLHRREEPDGAPPKAAMLSWGQVVGYDEVATIKVDAPAPAQVRGGRVTWTDRRGLAFGRRYVYVVTAVDSTGRSSPPSERLPVSFLAGPGPPRNLAAAPGERQVRLSWQPPATLLDGTPLSGEIRYQVLRGVGEEGPLVPVTPAPIAATAFTDTSVDNETTYRYAVRAVRTEPAGTARGEAAPTAAVTPVDLTPPPPPADLVAIPSAGAVRLAWKASPAEDVALYAVYRAAGSGGFVRIGTTTAVNTLFIDRDVAAGARYRYVVTALDRARRANESQRSNEVSVVIP